MNILIVDDEPGIRELLAGEFRYQNYQVQTAKDGLEALDWVKRESFELVLCDINMPRMGGLEFLEAFRKLNATCPVIIMTGYSTEEMALAARNRGASEFIPKPFNLEDLEQMVAKFRDKKTA